MGERTSTLIHTSRVQSRMHLLFLPSIDPHRKDLRALSTATSGSVGAAVLQI